jgi:hypothetical protein
MVISSNRDLEVAGRMAGLVDHAVDIDRRGLNPA